MNALKFFRLCSKNSFGGKMRSSQLLTTRTNNTKASMLKMPQDKAKFLGTLPIVMDNLLSKSQLAEVPEVASWVKEIFEYNIATGKNIRGMNTVLAYEMSVKPEHLNEESMKHARIMGWCVEMLQTYLLLLDDMMDGSETRRGSPCWYTLPAVGTGSVNDAIFVYTSLYETLNRYFDNHAHYTKFLKLFNQTLTYTAMGQHLDYTMAHRKKKDYTLFTMDRYLSIVKYKTAIYTYNLPVSLGLLLANISDEEIHRKSNNICLELGKLFQIQDDYIDCYHDVPLSGKSSTDIQEGKCTWLAVTALQLCSKSQRVIFEASYGSKIAENVKQIRRIYEDLEINKLYKETENELYESIKKQVNELPSELPAKLYLNLLDTIYMRMK